MLVKHNVYYKGRNLRIKCFYMQMLLHDTEQVQEQVNYYYQGKGKQTLSRNVVGLATYILQINMKADRQASKLLKLALLKGSLIFNVISIILRNLEHQALIKDTNLQNLSSLKMQEYDLKQNIKVQRNKQTYSVFTDEVAEDFEQNASVDSNQRLSKQVNQNQMRSKKSQLDLAQAQNRVSLQSQASQQSQQTIVDVQTQEYYNRIRSKSREQFYKNVLKPELTIINSASYCIYLINAVMFLSTFFDFMLNLIKKQEKQTQNCEEVLQWHIIYFSLISYVLLNALIQRYATSKLKNPNSCCKHTLLLLNIFSGISGLALLYIFGQGINIFFIKEHICSEKSYYKIGEINIIFNVVNIIISTAFVCTINLLYRNRVK